MPPAGAQLRQQALTHAFASGTARKRHSHEKLIRAPCLCNLQACTPPAPHPQSQPGKGQRHQIETSLRCSATGTHLEPTSPSRSFRGQTSFTNAPVRIPSPWPKCPCHLSRRWLRPPLPPANYFVPQRTVRDFKKDEYQTSMASSARASSGPSPLHESDLKRVRCTLVGRLQPDLSSLPANFIACRTEPQQIPSVFLRSHAAGSICKKRL